MTVPSPLPPASLRPRCDPASLPFSTTAEVAPLADPLGQARALEALAFGTGIRRDGFHLFVMGSNEAGRRRLVAGALAARAAREPVPPDLCYVRDFDDARRPRVLRLPAGRGRAFQRDVDAMLDDLAAAIPAALEGDEHRARLRAVEEEVREEHEKAMAALREKAQARGITLVRTPLGFALAPLRDGHVMPTEVFEALPAEDKARIEAAIEALQEELREIVTAMPRLEKALRERVRALARETTEAAVAREVDETAARWADEPAAKAHLLAVRADVVADPSPFLRPAESKESPPLFEEASDGAVPGGPRRRYRVHVVVDRAGERGAPVVEEPHPSHPNLVGRVEYLAKMGALVTDFDLLRAGALQRADGGYLVLEARALLTQPWAWEALKQSLRARCVRTESLGQTLGLLHTVTLEPEAAPLATKVVLTGEREVFRLLDAYDPDFRALFKVVVDLDEDLPRDGDGPLAYARFVAGVVVEEGLSPFDRGAVAAVVESGARWAGDAARLSARTEDLADLLREADWFAREAGAATVGAAHVAAAVAARERRLGRVRERLLEETLSGTLLVETTGRRVGTVNGLAVLDAGRFAFGRPARISARVRLGKGDVVDLEREVDLGGPVHSKGVLILSAFLGARFGADGPLAFHGTLAFEQSYGPVEGDSASCAELVALLSALADLPVRQDLAVTGSVDQHGAVQAVGGVSEKLEGFFDLCRARGLSGTQGALLPASNVRHLALRDDVVEAAAAGRFSVHAVATVDEAVELLTGVPAGVRGPDGTWTEGSVNARVAARLAAFEQRRREAARDDRRAAGKDGA